MSMIKIRRDPLAQELYAAAEEKRDSARDYLGMSEIGKPCERSLWYSFRGYPRQPFEGRVLMIFKMGDYIEDEIVKYLKLAGYDVFGSQEGFSDFNRMFRGHCDGFVRGITKQDHVLEVKSYNKRRFALLKKHGVRESDPVYSSQCQCYMGYSGLQRALFVAQCKDNSEIYTDRIKFNPIRFEELKEKALRIITSESPPERVDDDAACQWCDFKLQCENDMEAMAVNLCGTCKFFYFKKLTFMCSHPSHPLKLTGRFGCPDWINLFEKFNNELERVI